jgi:quinol monooxygenase YgiN
MVTVGVLARFEVKPGQEQDVAAFFKEGLPLVEAQPSTTMWFAFRLSETTYGAFAAFANGQDRDSLLASGGPQLSRKYAHLFAEAPSFDKVDVLEARL